MGGRSSKLKAKASSGSKVAETSANHDDSQEPTDNSVRRIQKLEMETEELQEENQRIKTAHETNLGAHMLMANKLQQQPVPQMQGMNGGDEILVSKLKVEPAEQKSDLKSICIVANSQQTEIERLRAALDENLSAQGMLSTAELQEHEGIFEVGEKVEAKWSKGASYYPGEISCRNADGTYNIQLEDGDKDENTKSEHIRRPEIKSAGRFVPLNERTSGVEGVSIEDAFEQGLITAREYQKCLERYRTHVPRSHPMEWYQMAADQRHAQAQSDLSSTESERRRAFEGKAFPPLASTKQVGFEWLSRDLPEFDVSLDPMGRRQLKRQLDEDTWKRSMLSFCSTLEIWKEEHDVLRERKAVQWLLEVVSRELSRGSSKKHNDCAEYQLAISTSGQNGFEWCSLEEPEFDTSVDAQPHEEPPLNDVAKMSLKDAVNMVWLTRNFPVTHECVQSDDIDTTLDAEAIEHGAVWWKVVPLPAIGRRQLQIMKRPLMTKDELEGLSWAWNFQRGDRVVHQKRRGVIMEDGPNEQGEYHVEFMIAFAYRYIRGEQCSEKKWLRGEELEWDEEMLHEAHEYHRGACGVWSGGEFLERSLYTGKISRRQLNTKPTFLRKMVRLSRRVSSGGSSSFDNTGESQARLLSLIVRFAETLSRSQDALHQVCEKHKFEDDPIPAPPKELPTRQQVEHNATYAALRWPPVPSYRKELERCFPLPAIVKARQPSIRSSKKRPLMTEEYLESCPDGVIFSKGDRVLHKGRLGVVLGGPNDEGGYIVRCISQGESYGAKKWLHKRELVWDEEMLAHESCLGVFGVYTKAEEFVEREAHTGKINRHILRTGPKYVRKMMDLSRRVSSSSFDNTMESQARLFSLIVRFAECLARSEDALNQVCDMYEACGEDSPQRPKQLPTRQQIEEEEALAALRWPPLPAYRKDFGYMVEDIATKRWVSPEIEFQREERVLLQLRDLFFFDWQAREEAKAAIGEIVTHAGLSYLERALLRDGTMDRLINSGNVGILYALAKKSQNIAVSAFFACLNTQKGVSWGLDILQYSHPSLTLDTLQLDKLNDNHWDNLLCASNQRLVENFFYEQPHLADFALQSCVRVPGNEALKSLLQRNIKFDVSQLKSLLLGKHNATNLRKVLKASKGTRLLSEMLQEPALSADVLCTGLQDGQLSMFTRALEQHVDTINFARLHYLLIEKDQQSKSCLWHRLVVREDTEELILLVLKHIPSLQTEALCAALISAEGAKVTRLLQNKAALGYQVEELLSHNEKEQSLWPFLLKEPWFEKVVEGILQRVPNVAVDALVSCLEVTFPPEFHSYDSIYQDSYKSKRTRMRELSLRLCRQMHLKNFGMYRQHLWRRLVASSDEEIVDELLKRKPPFSEDIFVACITEGRISEARRVLNHPDINFDLEKLESLMTTRCDGMDAVNTAWSCLMNVDSKLLVDDFLHHFPTLAADALVACISNASGTVLEYKNSTYVKKESNVSFPNSGKFEVKFDLSGLGDSGTCACVKILTNVGWQTLNGNSSIVVSAPPVAMHFITDRNHHRDIRLRVTPANKEDIVNFCVDLLSGFTFDEERMKQLLTFGKHTSIYKQLLTADHADMLANTLLQKLPGLLPHALFASISARQYQGALRLLGRIDDANDDALESLLLSADDDEKSFWNYLVDDDNTDTRDNLMNAILGRLPGLSTATLERLLENKDGKQFVRVCALLEYSAAAFDLQRITARLCSIDEQTGQSLLFQLHDVDDDTLPEHRCLIEEIIYHIPSLATFALCQSVQSVEPKLGKRLLKFKINWDQVARFFNDERWENLANQSSQEVDSFVDRLLAGNATLSTGAICGYMKCHPLQIEQISRLFQRRDIQVDCIARLLKNNSFLRRLLKTKGAEQLIVDILKQLPKLATSIIVECISLALPAMGVQILQFTDFFEIYQIEDFFIENKFLWGRLVTTIGGDSFVDKLLSRMPAFSTDVVCASMNALQCDRAIVLMLQRENYVKLPRVETLLKTLLGKLLVAKNGEQLILEILHRLPLYRVSSIITAAIIECIRLALPAIGNRLLIFSGDVQERNKGGAMVKGKQTPGAANLAAKKKWQKAVEKVAAVNRFQGNRKVKWTLVEAFLINDTEKWNKLAEGTEKEMEEFIDSLLLKMPKLTTDALCSHISALQGERSLQLLRRKNINTSRIENMLSTTSILSQLSAVNDAEPLIKEVLKQFPRVATEALCKALHNPINIESAHPYQNNADQYFKVSFPGLASLEVSFDPQSQTEKMLDYVTFLKDDDNLNEHWERKEYSGTNWPVTPLVIPASSFVVRFHSDYSVAGRGFKLQVAPVNMENNIKFALKFIFSADEVAFDTDILGQHIRSSVDEGNVLAAKIMQELKPCLDAAKVEIEEDDDATRECWAVLNMLATRVVLTNCSLSNGGFVYEVSGPPARRHPFGVRRTVNSRAAVTGTFDLSLPPPISSRAFRMEVLERQPYGEIELLGVADNDDDASFPPKYDAKLYLDRISRMARRFAQHRKLNNAERIAWIRRRVELFVSCCDKLLFTNSASNWDICLEGCATYPCSCSAPSRKRHEIPLSKLRNPPWPCRAFLEAAESSRLFLENGHLELLPPPPPPPSRHEFKVLLDSDASAIITQPTFAKLPLASAHSNYSCFQDFLAERTPVYKSPAEYRAALALDAGVKRQITQQKLSKFDFFSDSNKPYFGSTFCRTRRNHESMMLSPAEYRAALARDIQVKKQILEALPREHPLGDDSQVEFPNEVLNASVIFEAQRRRERREERGLGRSTEGSKILEFDDAYTRPASPVKGLYMASLSELKGSYMTNEQRAVRFRRESVQRRVLEEQIEEKRRKLSSQERHERVSLFPFDPISFVLQGIVNQIAAPKSIDDVPVGQIFEAEQPLPSSSQTFEVTWLPGESLLMYPKNERSRGVEGNRDDGQGGITSAALKDDREIKALVLSDSQVSGGGDAMVAEVEQRLAEIKPAGPYVPKNERSRGVEGNRDDGQGGITSAALKDDREVKALVLSDSQVSSGGDVSSSGLSSNGVAALKVQVVRGAQNTVAEWLQKAADQGNAEAQYNLGFEYEQGQGVPQNHSTAAKWYQKAADQGHAAAQHSLGTIYATGRGVPRDLSEAYRWFLMAHAQGVEQAAAKIQQVLKDQQEEDEAAAIAAVTNTLRDICSEVADRSTAVEVHLIAEKEAEAPQYKEEEEEAAAAAAISDGGGKKGNAGGKRDENRTEENETHRTASTLSPSKPSAPGRSAVRPATPGRRIKHRDYGDRAPLSAGGAGARRGIGAGEQKNRSRDILLAI